MSVLSDHVDVIMGQAPSGDQYNDRGEGWPLIAGAGDFAGSVPRPKKYTITASKLSRPGDIVIGIRASIGSKVWSDGEYCLGRGVAALRPRETVDGSYVWHWFEANRTLLESKARGATFLQVNRADIAELPFEPPPLPEQRRIASILDQAQNRTAKSRDLKSWLADLEFSVYQSFASAGSGSVRLGDLACFVRGVTFKPESVIDPGEEGALRFMRTTNVKDQLDTSDVKAIAPSVKVREEQMLRDGDILVSTANSWNLVGRASYVGELPWPSTFGGFVSVLRPNRASVSPRFLYSWFTSPRVQSTLRSFGQQTTNISNLNTARALELRVPVLNVEDRERFENAIAKVDGLRIALCRQESLADELVSTLRAQAFRGEL